MIVVSAEDDDLLGKAAAAGNHSDDILDSGPTETRVCHCRCAGIDVEWLEVPVRTSWSDPRKLELTSDILSCGVEALGTDAAALSRIIC
jgi:hypothetical protein